MAKKTIKDYVNRSLRIFILDLLRERELTVAEIAQCIWRDYHKDEYVQKKILKIQEIQDILYKMKENYLITRRKLSRKERSGKSRYIYTSTDKGRKRREYYQKKLNEQGGA